MSSITRKNKRRAAFKCAKQGIAPAQAIAVSAAREIQATMAATTENNGSLAAGHSARCGARLWQAQR